MSNIDYGFMDREISTVLKPPIDCLPKDIQASITELNRILGLPKDFYFLSTLVSISVAIGKSIRISAANGTYKQPASIYGCVVGASSSGKTPAVSWAMKPIQLRAKSNYEEYTQAIAMFRKLSKEEQIERGDPIPTDLLSTEATIEALFQILMCETNKSLLLYKDELIAWVKGMNAYRGGKGADLEHFLSIWSSSSIKLNRVNKRGYVSEPYMSILGGTQPKVLADFTKNRNMDNGMFQRILWAFPSPTIADISLEKFDVEKIDRSIHSNYDRVESLSDWNKGKHVPCSKEAEELWVTYSATLKNLQRLPQHYDTSYSACLGKLEQYCLRFALIYEFLDTPEGATIDEISQTSMVKAYQTTEYFHSMTKKVLGHLANPLSAMNQIQKMLYEALPNEPFKASKYIPLAEEKFATKRTSFYRFLNDKKYFDKHKSLFQKIYQ